MKTANRLAANIGYYQKMNKVKQKELMIACGIKSRSTFNAHVDKMTMTVDELKIVARCLSTTPEKLLKGVE